MRYLSIHTFISLTAILLLQLASAESSLAQCVACYQSSDGSCTTELVNRNGAEGCGCDTGCNCTGQCTIVGEAFNLEDFIHSGTNIPASGLMASIETHNIDNILSEFRHEGIIGEKIISNVWFNDQIAIYKLNDIDFMIYPVKDNKMDLQSCNGEHLATIYDKSKF